MSTPARATAWARSSRGGSRGAGGAVPWAGRSSLAACDNGRRDWLVGGVAEDVAVAQLDSDLGGDIGQFVDIGGKVAAAGLLAKVVEQARARRFFGGPCARRPTASKTPTA